MQINEVEIEYATAKWHGDTTTWDSTKVDVSFHDIGYTDAAVQFEFYANDKAQGIRIPIGELRKLAELARAVEAINNPEF
jgi:hypothetical protein